MSIISRHLTVSVDSFIDDMRHEMELSKQKDLVEALNQELDDQDHEQHPFQGGLAPACCLFFLCMCI